jgi:hypothetical protein
VGKPKVERRQQLAPLAAYWDNEAKKTKRKESGTKREEQRNRKNRGNQQTRRKMLAVNAATQYYTLLVEP